MISQPWFNHQWHQRIELLGKISTGFNVVIILPQNFYLISSSHGPIFTSSTENKDIIFFSVFLVSCILSICLWIDLHLQGNRGKNHKIYRCACHREIQKKIFLKRTRRRTVRTLLGYRVIIILWHDKCIFLWSNLYNQLQITNATFNKLE